jgi:hypothetical protein
MKKRFLLSLSAAALFLGACAHTSKSAAAPTKDATPAPAAAPTPDYSKQPVQVGTGVIVAATPAQVWTVLSDLDQWGAWNPKVTKLTAGPGLNAGTTISYTWEEREVKATLEDVKEASLLQWHGARSGADVTLKWMLIPVPAGSSVNLFAILKPGAGATPQANALNEVQAWLDALKVEAEKRFPAPVAPVTKAKKAGKKAAKTAVSKP